MALFHTKKKPQPTPCCCDGCDGGCEPQNTTESAIQVLGGGCKNCHKLLDNTNEALKSLGLDEQAELVTDMAKIAASGVMATPALLVDGKVVSAGRVLTAEQAKDAIAKARA